MSHPSTRAAVAALAVAGLVTAVVTAAPAQAANVPPIQKAGSGMVRATAMPTPQVDGVVWTQTIIGNTVYAGGDFAHARPAGAAPGEQEVVRKNLLAYDITTGDLLPFAPDPDNAVYSLASSPDNSRLYVGGLFQHVADTNVNRIAAFNASSGQIVTAFHPGPEYAVYAITATNKTVFFGGKFNSVGGTTRSNLAAVRAADGALLDWNPVADDRVRGLALTPNKKSIVVAGSFLNMNGQTVHGLTSVSVATGQTQPFAANQTIQDWGSAAGFYSLTTDGKNVYPTGFNFGGTGNFEGAASVNPASGQINWIDACRGDTYSSYPSDAAVYVVGHPHICSQIGGFPQVTDSGDAYRTLAFSKTATGTVQSEQFTGQPAPSIKAWFPLFDTGTATPSKQAAWSVTGNEKYVVMGGEFEHVNGQPQQGLVRFAVASISPNTQGPRLSQDTWTPKADGAGSGTLQLTVPQNWDRDDLTLTYTVVRELPDFSQQRTVDTRSFSSVPWALGSYSFTDSGKPGTTYKYKVTATDPAGNSAVTYLTATMPGS